jgi:hypothetical protein
MNIAEAIRLALVSESPDMAERVYRRVIDLDEDVDLRRLVDYCAADSFPNADDDFLYLLSLSPKVDKHKSGHPPY